MSSVGKSKNSQEDTIYSSKVRKTCETRYAGAFRRFIFLTTVVADDVHMDPPKPTVPRQDRVDDSTPKRYRPVQVQSSDEEMDPCGDEAMAEGRLSPYSFDLY
jgi:hypothetical protein